MSSGWFGVVGVSVCRLMSLGTSAGAAHSEEGDLAVGGVDRSLGICAGAAHSSSLRSLGGSAGAAHKEGEDLVVGGVDRSLGSCAGEAHNSSLSDVDIESRESPGLWAAAFHRVGAFFACRGEVIGSVVVGGVGAGSVDVAFACLR